MDVIEGRVIIRLSPAALARSFARTCEQNWDF